MSLRMSRRHDAGDEGEADVGGGADDAREHGAVFLRPDLHDQRDAERPFAAHAERGDEAQRGEVPRRLREIDEAGERCVDCGEGECSLTECLAVSRRKLMQRCGENDEGRAEQQ